MGIKHDYLRVVGEGPFMVNGNHARPMKPSERLDAYLERQKAVPFRDVDRGPELQAMTEEGLLRAEKAMQSDAMFSDGRDDFHFGTDIPADIDREVQAAEGVEGWYTKGEEDRQAITVGYVAAGALVLVAAAIIIGICMALGARWW